MVKPYRSLLHYSSVGATREALCGGKGSRHATRRFARQLKPSSRGSVVRLTNFGLLEAILFLLRAFLGLYGRQIASTIPRIRRRVGQFIHSFRLLFLSSSLHLSPSHAFSDIFSDFLHLPTFCMYNTALPTNHQQVPALLPGSQTSSTSLPLSLSLTPRAPRTFSLFSASSTVKS